MNNPNNAPIVRPTITKSEAKKDALTLVKAAKSKFENAKWKTRQDWRTANEIYRLVCAAENALTLAQAEKEPEDEPMVQGDPNANL